MTQKAKRNTMPKKSDSLITTSNHWVKI